MVDERVPADARVRVFRLRPEPIRRAPGLARSAAGALGRAAGLVQAPCRGEGDVMTGPRSVSCTIDVGVDPHTAFTAFTDEMDNWWMRSPISFYDTSTRQSRAGANEVSAAASSRCTTKRVMCSSWVVSRCGNRASNCNGSARSTTSKSRCASHRFRTARTYRCTALLPGGDEKVTGSFSFVARRSRLVREVVQPARRHGVTRAVGPRARQPSAVLPQTGRGHALARHRVRVRSSAPAGRGRCRGQRGSSSTSVTTRSSSSGSRASGRKGAPVTLMPWVYVDDLDAHFAQARDAGASDRCEPIHQHGYPRT